jgi:hypothetical protein
VQSLDPAKLLVYLSSHLASSISHSKATAKSQSLSRIGIYCDGRIFFSMIFMAELEVMVDWTILVGVVKEKKNSRR